MNVRWEMGLQFWRNIIVLDKWRLCTEQWVFAVLCNIFHIKPEITSNSNRVKYDLFGEPFNYFLQKIMFVEIELLIPQQQHQMVLQSSALLFSLARFSSMRRPSSARIQNA